MLQQMVHLRVMEGFVALIRIPGMMKLRNCLMLHGVKLELEWRIATNGWLLGSHCWGITKKKLNYSENMLILAVQAAVRLHNFIMNTEDLSYAAYESPEMVFQRYF